MNAAHTKLVVAMALIVAVSAPLAAQSAAVKITEAAPGLLKRARVTGDAAIAAAQAKVPKGVLDTAEIEEEDGKLIYSLIFKIAGTSGVEEVAVDALTGKVLGVEHETLESIAKEKKADSIAAEKAKAKAAAAGRGRGGR